ncbi:MAG: 5-formyltetrahydrofolate cyclo-ligase [Xanthomonadaceae bacterium]|nr:5-formyltetrahydrofolate cyclo-ligase [Xanthomonadaceae bacterium]
MKDERTDLRRDLRASRRAIPASERMAAAESLARQLLALPFAPRSGAVAGYWAMDGEIALHAWQVQLPPGLTYCLPVLHDETGLRFAPWRAGAALITNRFGIPEPDVSVSDLLDPAAMTLVVVPLVGYDNSGHRLGMGGGWYDRTFFFRKTQPAPPYLVGAAFSVQQLEQLPAQPWDVRLDAICTEHLSLIIDEPKP